MHTIFIQFYWNRKLHDEVKLLIRDNYETIMETSSETVLSNGFSSVYHKCKSMGDFVWIPYDLNGGIKDILVISDPSNIGNFVRLLGSGKDFGVKISYEVQDKPEGIAQAFIIGEKFIGLALFIDDFICHCGDERAEGA